MAWDVSTEWDDIHRKLGNLPEKEKVPTQEEIMNNVIDAIEKAEPLKYLTHDELGEIEDDLEEAVFRKYRQDRLNEMLAEAKKPKFGQVIEITKQNFIAEVNEAPPETIVIIHLYQDYIVHCRLIDECMNILAKKFLNHKFIKIQATRCVENFRDTDCPAIIVYKNADVIHQFIACANLLGGSKISPETIEWVFAEKKIWSTELEENPFESRRPQKKQVRKNEDESDSDDDREYASNQIRKYKFN